MYELALVHGMNREGEEVKSTNPVLIGAKDINGNAILLTTDVDGKLRVATDLEIASVTATDVTIHDPTTPDNKLKINADGSLPVQLSGSYVEIGGVSFVVSGGDTLRGKSADKPDAVAAHAAIPFCYYFSVDTGIVEVTDGTNWVVI